MSVHMKDLCASLSDDFLFLSLHLNYFLVLLFSVNVSCSHVALEKELLTVKTTK